jgi:hypothetical protein
MHHGCVCSRPMKAGGSSGVVADIAKLSVGREEYYGAAAASLGLEGEASVAGFQAMFEGRHPTTGQLLGRPHGRNAVPAFDVVLRPTKSVSILYGLGDAATGRAVLAAHHAGLGRGGGVPGRASGGPPRSRWCPARVRRGLLAVGFDHRTSREGDPLLHTHLVVAADAIYRATYQRELVRTLGVEWTAADGHGNRELQGVSEALVRSFSKRTGQIDAELERLDARVGSGRRGWSSGRSRPPASPSNTRPRTACTTDSGPRRPSADTSRTPWSGR